MTRPLMLKQLVVGAIMTALLGGCYQHRVDTAEKRCKQIGSVDLERKYRQFWAMILSVHREEAGPMAHVRVLGIDTFHPI